MELPLCSSAYDDVTDFEICGFHKNTKISISREQNIIFSSKKKNHQLHIKRYFMTKNSFVAEVTFKGLSIINLNVFEIAVHILSLI